MRDISAPNLQRVNFSKRSMMILRSVFTKKECTLSGTLDIAGSVCANGELNVRMHLHFVILQFHAGACITNIRFKSINKGHVVFRATGDTSKCCS